MLNLHEKIAAAFEMGKPRPNIPSHITDNLKYELFAWQKEALEHFLAHENRKENGEVPDGPTHLMFNMATGSGKTLLMAAAMLHYYKQGYRHFLFFVNRKNIVEKTADNFINATHRKHLFRQGIEIDGRLVKIKEVEAFSDKPQCLEIKFTSIQRLHNDVHVQKENQTTLDDLHRKKIVMLADEAHHLNTETQGQGYLNTEIRNNAAKKELERKGWEHTVIHLILKKGETKLSRNVLLEFTATLPEVKSVAQKYADKIIYKFELKEFLRLGYTKEINLISSTLKMKERMLQALVFAWYRHRIAQKWNLHNFKPVVLFRSKDIAASKRDHDMFLKLTDEINPKDFNFLNRALDAIQAAGGGNANEMARSRVVSILNFIKKQDIQFREITNWVRSSYQERNVIITNSKENDKKKEETDEGVDKLLNSLEDRNNSIRAIFTVQRLTEGWDVSNLFDIVRLCEGQNAGGNAKKTPEATIQEKQLIGRGVRYFPFSYEDKRRNKRKFDDDLGHDLRALEELYFHTYDEQSKYISHLKKELENDGYFPDDKIKIEFDLKQSFKESALYKKGMIAYNKQKGHSAMQLPDLSCLKNVEGIRSFEYRSSLFRMAEEATDLSQRGRNRKKLDVESKCQVIRNAKFGDIEKHVFYKALHRHGAKGENSHFRFENMINLLQIESVDDLYSGLKDFKIRIVSDVSKYEDLDADEKLQLTMDFLGRVFGELKKRMFRQWGGEFRLKKFSDVFKEGKSKRVKPENLEDEGGDISGKNWYVLNRFAATSEERGLVEFIKDNISQLEGRYKHVYLVRNEEVYKIYDFDTGKGFQPDYLLFLGDKGKPSLYYMVFIEPKGEIFMDMTEQQWKEDFLKKITERHGHVSVDGKQGTPLVRENSAYRLYAVGLPFYNMAKSEDFKKEFREYILDAHGRNRMETEK